MKKKLLILLFLSFSILLNSQESSLSNMLDEVLTQEGLEVIDEISEVTVSKEVEIKPEDFVFNYYKNIKHISLEKSFSLLKERYQNSVGGFDEYSSWWNSVDFVEVGNFKVVSQNVNNMDAVVGGTVTYHINDIVLEKKYDNIVLTYDKIKKTWMFR